MLSADVNILVNAHRRESPFHDAALEWLEGARRGDVPVALPDVVLAGFVRVVTNHRIFREPSPIDDALTFVDRLLASPPVLRMAPGPRHWSIFSGLCRTLDIRGGLVSDAYLAALAIEQGATLVTADRDFARFPGLQWRHLSDG